MDGRGLNKPVLPGRNPLDKLAKQLTILNTCFQLKLKSSTVKLAYADLRRALSTFNPQLAKQIILAGRLLAVISSRWRRPPGAD